MRALTWLNLLAFFVLTVSLYIFILIQQHEHLSSQNFGSRQNEDSLSEAQGLQLVIYHPRPSPIINPNDDKLSLEPVSLSLSLSSDQAKRLSQILAALKEILSPATLCHEMRESLCQDRLSRDIFWPEELSAPEVFLSDRVNGLPMAILNFQLENTPNLSIQQEKALFSSIEENLRRNGINQSHILINNAQRAVFLRHLSLAEELH
ncbi:MAG: hypothetical protein R2880_03025 [Deinococcales bacterium]